MKNGQKVINILKDILKEKKPKNQKWDALIFCDKKQRSGFCDKMSYNINI